MACLALFALPWSGKGMKISKRYALADILLVTSYYQLHSGKQSASHKQRKGWQRQTLGAWRLRHDMQEIAEARKHTMEMDNKTKVIATIAAVVLVVDGVTGGVAWHNQQEAVQAAQQLAAAQTGLLDVAEGRKGRQDGVAEACGRGRENHGENR